jgi:hypothetical protein
MAEWLSVSENEERMSMGKYFVEVRVGGDSQTFTAEAYSPVEAAFLAGIQLGVLTTLLDARSSNTLGRLSVQAAAAEILDVAQQELSGVLVQEERYAR